MPDPTPLTAPDSLIKQLSDLDDRHQFRRRRAVRIVDAAHVEIGGRHYTNFASNNYLGLTHHPRLLAAAEKSLRARGLGSGAAALVTGYTEEHAAAETALAAWKGAEAAVLLPSGYQANHAAVQTLAAVGQRRSGVRFLIDKLAHASLLDAVRGTGHEFRVFPHNGMKKLQRLLADAPSLQLQVVVTESIFSMDGDAAELAALADLKRAYSFVLLLDEAHGSGVYGEGGAGYAAELGLGAAADLTVVTLSKSMGLMGGAICASRAWCDAVVNFGRAYLFSTSIPPLLCAATREAIEVMRDEPQRQTRVRLLARRVRREWRNTSFDVADGDSPIVPVIFGTEEAALTAAKKLEGAGLLVPAIRPPTVPPGSSRLRVTLCCEHSDEEVSQLIGAMISLQPRTV